MQKNIKSFEKKLQSFPEYFKTLSGGLGIARAHKRIDLQYDSAMFYQLTKFVIMRLILSLIEMISIVLCRQVWWTAYQTSSEVSRSNGEPTSQASWICLS